MKSIFLLASALFVFNLGAQDIMEQIMEKRAREFHRVLGLSDKESYIKFMKENYTKEFLEKPIKMNRTVNESDGGSSNESTKPVDNLDAKAGMYEQLHNDFGGVAISSLTRKDNKIEIIMKSLGLKGKFTLSFNKEKPYLIDGMSVEANMEN